jgi:cbb3-type cytochrome oxidase subunit 3
MKTINTLVLVATALVFLTYITFALIGYGKEILNDSKILTMLN